jgi:signal transduction histidine kinase
VQADLAVKYAQRAGDHERRAVRVAARAAPGDVPQPAPHPGQVTAPVGGGLLQLAGDRVEAFTAIAGLGAYWLARSALSPVARLRRQVHDNGPGFPDAFLPHAFERFRRPDTGRSRDDGGAGLGLAIVAAICAAHGGRAMAGNKPGGGAIVSLWLPGQIPEAPMREPMP